METKRNLALQAQREEIEKRHLRECSECTAKRRAEDDFRNQKHSEILGRLATEKERERNFFDKETDRYRKENHAKWRKSKYFWRYWVVLFLLIVAVGGNIYLFWRSRETERYMKAYNDTLKYFHRISPKANIPQAIQIFERPEINPERHKLMRERIEEYEDFWWLRE